MASEEIIQALRQCAKRDCSSCGMCPIFQDRECVEHLAAAATSLIERLTAENAALRKEIEWKDMVIALAQREQAKALDAADLIDRLTAENAALREKQAEAEAERDALLDIAKNGKDCDTCKHCEVCVQPGIDVAHWCDRCVEKCPCHGCGGDHWEWRGLPEAPEEGDKHGTADK